MIDDPFFLFFAFFGHGIFVFAVWSNAVFREPSCIVLLYFGEH